MPMVPIPRDDPAGNPLDLAEALARGNDWAVDRRSESELVVRVAGRWCTYQMYILWQADLSAVLFSCQFDLKVPQTKRAMTYDLLATVNADLWLGHFDFVLEENALMYRHTIPLRGAPGMSVEQLEDLIDVAVVECERFYPALQLVVWGGKSVAEALRVAWMDTLGEA